MRYAFFFVFLYFSVISVYSDNMVDRKILTSEITEARIDSGKLILKGWAVLRNVHHQRGNDTHSFDLIVESKTTREIPLPLSNVDMTTMLEYRGYSLCEEGGYYVENCNYIYNNVGFEIDIPISDWEFGQYSLYLRFNSKILNISYVTPLFLTETNEVSGGSNGKSYVIKSITQTGSVTINAPNLVSVVEPKYSSETQVLKIGSSCSPYHGSNAFYRNGGVFNNLTSISKYKGLISYFKVNIKDDGCFDSRRRVSEGFENTVHIPSTFLSYNGKPMTISISPILPRIVARDITIMQYDHADLFLGITATDPTDSNFKFKIKSDKAAIDTRFVGSNYICYYGTNKWNNSTQSCRNITVKKRKTRYRYINKDAAKLLKSVVWPASKILNIILSFEEH